MNRPRLIRGIKITWSALCGLAAVVLAGWWVRSYWWMDMFQMPVGNGVTASVFSCQGAQRITTTRRTTSKIKLQHHPTSELILAKPDNAFGFEAKRFASGFSITVPYWLPTLL